MVGERIQYDFSALTTFAADVVARGAVPTGRWLKRSIDDATAEDTFALGFLPGMPLFRLDRIRYADGVPVLVEQTVVPAECLASIDAVEDSLYDALRTQGFDPARVWRRLQAVTVEQEFAQLLGVAAGAPGLLIERRSYDAAGRLIEVTKSHCRGDAYAFVSDLAIGG